MSNKNYGECHICGKKGELTFEHIPPKMAFNWQGVKIYNLDEVLKKSKGEQAKYNNSQKGMGRYTLCNSCNNNTGAWYADTYSDFAMDVIKSIHKSEPLEHGDIVQYKFKKCPVLQIAKQVIAMFCSQLPYQEVHRLGFDTLLLEKESNEVNTELFDLRMYLTSPDVPFLMTGLSKVIYQNNDKSFDIIQVAELCAYPFGFILNLNPEIPVTDGGSIMDMFNVKYNDICNVTLNLIYLEKCSNESPLPLSFKKLPE